RIDHGVDQRRLAGGERLGQRPGQARRVLAMVAPAAERLDDPLVAGVAQEAGRRIRPVGRVAAIDAVVVEDDRRHRQLVAADRLDFNAAETKGAVALDRDVRLAGQRGRAYRLANPDPMDSPGYSV